MLLTSGATVSGETVAPDAVHIEDLAACPLCGCERLKLFAKSYDRLYLVDRREFIYSRCSDCDLIFQSRRPIEADTGRFYPADYGPYKQASGKKDAAPSVLRQLGKKIFSPIGAGLAAAARTVLPSRFEKNYSRIYDLPSDGGALLDFGCGSDKFLNTARKRGWETTGVDFSPIAIEQARRSGHRAYLISDRTWDELADESFDLVRLSHVLEHLYEPVDVVSRLFAKMKPGARIHFALPNPACLSARFGKSYWFALDCPRHIMLFTPARIEKFLNDAGFEDVTVLHEVVAKDMARSLVYRLYEAGLAKHSTVDTIIQNRFIDALLYVPAWLGAACGMGERIHITATKPLRQVRLAA